MNYFIPSAPSFFRAAAAGISEAARERRIKSGGERGGGRNAEKTTRTRTKGRIKKNKKKPLDVFYTSSGYCIRIYYNLRIPEEEKDCGGGRGGGTHRFDGREMDEERTMRKTIARSSNRPTDRPTDLSRSEQKIYRRNKSKERGGERMLDRVGEGGSIEFTG